MALNQRLKDLLQRLLRFAYPELEKSTASVSTSKMSPFASVSWETNLDYIDIVCSDVTETWHDAALSGLIAHELSHPLQKDSCLSEEKTDLDVLKRGLGLYLAVERLVAGKYEDHVVGRGDDRYLGYRTIRGELSNEELSQLDRLLANMRFIPQGNIRPRDAVHDLARVQRGKNIHLLLNGSEILIHDVGPSVEIQIVENDGAFSVIVDGQERA